MSTPTIKIAVSQADATLVQSITLTAGMVNLPVVKFAFTEEWTGLGKTAVVRAGSTVLEVLVTNNQITVPYECLETAGVNLIIGVYGTDATVVIPTVWCACGEILDGTDTSSAANPGTPTQPLVDQMLAYAQEIEAIAESMEDHEIVNVAVNTTGANAYGIASVSLNDSGVGDDRTLTFYFTNLKGNGIESITWSAAGTYRGRIQITLSDGTVTNFDALISAIDYLESLTNRSEAYAIGTIDGTAVPSSDAAYHNNSKYYAEQAQAYAGNASSAQTGAETQALKSEGYAIGEQNGTAVSSGTYYHNNAKYYAEQASNAQTAAETAQGLAEDARDTASDKADDASTYAGNADSYSNQARIYSLDSEAWAKGTRNGEAVSNGTDGYHDNSKYYSEESASSASASASSASSANTQALKSEGYAIGQQNGEAVSSGTYYHNNAKYYSEQSSSSASTSETQALKAEGYAVGSQNGTDVSSGTYYENNAKYYSELASQAATANGYAMLYVDDDGALYLTRTTNAVDLLNFSLTSDGVLEATISG